jgi:phosphotransferase system enzyme I (PtsI)
VVGIVVVSHSAPLAAAAAELAAQMVQSGGPPLALAAGTGDGGLGTDAARVAAAVDEVAAAAADGVLVIADLGSAVLSAELALELRASDAPVRITSAPLVEGLVAAVVSAGSGAALEAVAAEAERALAPKQAHLGAEHPEQPEQAGAAETEPTDAGAAGAPARITVRNRAGLHARPAAALAGALAGFACRVALRNLRTGARVDDASSMSRLLTLDARLGDVVEAHASGPDADAALAALRGLAAEGFGEGVEPETLAQPSPALEPPAPRSAPASARSVGRRPIGVSPGIAVGEVVRLGGTVAEPERAAPLPVSERAAAAASVASAFAAVRAALEHRAARLAEPRLAPARGVLEATAALAADRALAQLAAGRVTEDGTAPERAVWETLEELAETLSRQGGAAAERAADVRDLRERVVARLAGRADAGLPERAEPFVLVADEFAPADAALLGTTGCVGLVTAAGGPTSHTSIIVRSLGLPAVITPAAARLAAGETVLVDGSSGEVVVRPTPERIAQASALARVPRFGGAGVTADGHRVELLVNVASGADAAEGAAARAEGVGLLRTELAFLGRPAAPGVAEQLEAYRPVLAAFPGRKVVARTLDAGSDKPLAFVQAGAEPNPALGVRGYRVAQVAPAVLQDQLAALAAAGRESHAELRVMAPMIATAGEAREFAAAVRAHGLGPVGAMVETPSAALTARELLAELDFVSIGTNDLAQYTMAADRELAELAELSDPWQPAVLRLIGLVGAAGVDAGKPVGVCGEAAADPALAPVLVGLGVSSLSMAPRTLDRVAAALARVTLTQCVAAATAAAEAGSPAEARTAAAAALAASAER